MSASSVNGISGQRELSFYDYKINYNRCLGSGGYGVVYEVVKRPENEKHALSYWCPYMYDFIYRAGEQSSEPTRLCIKITKFALTILLENFLHPLSIKWMMHSFKVLEGDRESHRLFRKHGLSDLEFYETSSSYSQFKTRVMGETFEYYLNKNSFLDAHHYKLRESFVTFLRKILNPRIIFQDFHRTNIMFDEEKSLWQVVDGNLIELEFSMQSANKDDDNINWLYGGNLDLWLIEDLSVHVVFEKMAKVARKSMTYTMLTDRKLMSRVF